MNLVQDPWLPFQLSDGKVQSLPISVICRADIIDFALPRADFQGAAYQFAIGLLQTVFAPEDAFAWQEYFDEAPTEKTLIKAFTSVQHAFNATGDGPLFMQDFADLSAIKPTIKIATIATLLIGAPGQNGKDNNTDHFIKRGIGELMSLEMAVLALFTLQVYGYSFGGSYRQGLRGTSQLTTLVMPQHKNASLWQKLWLNVINNENWCYSKPNFHDGSVFPWLVPTKSSTQKGTEIYANNVHPLHMFWAMPQRIRLLVESNTQVCQISGHTAKQCVQKYYRQSYGNNYSGAWTHPLTPYKRELNKPDQFHKVVKAQPEKIAYKSWHNLTYTSDIDGQRCAAVVKHFYSVLDLFTDKQSQIPCLWVFGYDIKSSKVNGWYCTTMPLFRMPPERQDIIYREIKQFQALAAKALWCCRRQIKAAWFDNPANARGDTEFIDTAFWQRTEVCFFTVVAEFIESVGNQNTPCPSKVAKKWLQALHDTCLNLFDEYVLSALGNELGNGRDMSKRMHARSELVNWLSSGKDIRRFKTNYQITVKKEVK